MARVRERAAFDSLHLVSASSAGRMQITDRKTTLSQFSEY